MTVQPSERAAGSEDDLGGEWAASLVTEFASAAGSCGLSLATASAWQDCARILNETRDGFIHGQICDA